MSLARDNQIINPPIMIHDDTSSGVWARLDTYILQLRAPHIDITAYPYYADNTGVLDVTSTIQSAINTNTGIIFFPPGTYKVTSAISWTKNNIVLMGAGKGVTNIVCTNATSDIFNIGNGTANPNNSSIQNMSISASVSKTAGAGIRFQNGHNLSIRSIRLDSNLFTAVQFDGGTSQFIYWIDDFEIGACSSGILIGQNGSQLTQDVFISRGVISGAVDSGIKLVNCGGVYVSQVDALGGGGGIAFVPASGQKVTGCFFSDVLADTNNNVGWYFNPTGTGIVSAINMSNCWGASCLNAASAGLSFNNSGGTIKGINVNGFRALNNKGNGIILNAGTNITFTGCQSGDNSQATANTYHGINIDNNVSNWSIVGGVYGDIDTLPNQQAYGIFIGTGCTNYSVIGANLTGNSIGAISDNSGVVGAVLHNIGVSDFKGWSAPTLTNSWVNYGAGNNNAGYWKDAYGDVHLRGIVKDGTIGTSIFTLPTGYRPPSRSQHVCASNNAFGLTQINTDGTVVATTGSNINFILDGITFQTN